MKEGREKKHDDEEQIAEISFLALDNFGEFFPQWLRKARAQLPVQFILPIHKKLIV